MTDYVTLLRDHVTLTCRSVDRIFLQAYLPKLQSVGLVCRFLRWQRRFFIPSSAAFGKIGDGYVAAVHRFAKRNGIPVVHFQKGENKEAVARPLIDDAAREGGDGRVVLIGIAQEKASVWRSWVAKGQQKLRHPHMEWGRQMAFVNHFYFYLWDPDWGGAFWKTNACAPRPIWIWLNGHEWAKRQLDKAGISYEALDNGFRSCEDPRALQRICDRVGPGAVKSFFWRWVHRLPSPFTRSDLRAGYTYELAFRQFELSDTRVFDRPPAGRAFFEGVIRDHLDVGRPQSVALIFDRRITRKTPGTFRTKVITKGVDPEVCCYYRSVRLKQYCKEHRALRTETVIGDTRDFGIGRRVNAENWHALRAVGELANQRLCDAQAADAQPAPDVVTFNQVPRPSDLDGLHAPGLRFGDPRVMAAMAAVVGFPHLVAGFNNRPHRPGRHSPRCALHPPPSHLRPAPPETQTAHRTATPLQPLSAHRPRAAGRRPVHQNPRTGPHPGLVALDPRLPDDIARRSPLARAWRQLDRRPRRVHRPPAGHGLKRDLIVNFVSGKRN